MDKIAFEERPVKLINLAHSGSGKTGALASLANAGWRIFLFDFDNGFPIMRTYLTPEGMKNVYVKVFTDKMQTKGTTVLPKGAPTAFVHAMQTLNKWTEEEGENLGSPNNWGLETIVVIDSLTFMARASMRYGINFNTGGKTDRDSLNRWMHPWPADYGEAQQRVEKFFEMMYCEDVKCHMVVNAHIKYIGGGGTQAVKDKATGEVFMREVDSALTGHGHPEVVGRALSPFIARYFNTMVMSGIQGEGLSSKRVIHTLPQDRVALKSELPGVLPPVVKLDGGNPDSGLAKIFKLLTGKTIPSTTTK